MGEMGVVLGVQFGLLFLLRLPLGSSPPERSSRSALNRRMSAASRSGSGEERTSANVVRNLFGRAVLTVLDDASRLVLRQETRDDDALRGGRGRTVPTSRFGKIASSRADALFCDQVVERVDLGVEHFEVALAVGAVLAQGGGLARHHRLIEMVAVGPADLICVGGANLAHRRPARPRGGKL